MKYYIPTTTLNFSNILSSEAISPSSRYGIRTLGFNHLELSGLNPSPDHLFVYDLIPDWEMEPGNNDDYPLILELDESAVPLPAFHIVSTEPRRIWATSKTIYLSPSTARFLFRSTSDMNRMRVRVTGTLENKCEDLYREKDCFALVPLITTHPLCRTMSERLVEWAKCNRHDHSEDIKSDVESERRSGSELGYSIGIWFQSITQTSPSTTNSKQTMLQKALKRVGIVAAAFEELLVSLGVRNSSFLALIPDEPPSTYRPHSRCPNRSLSCTDMDPQRKGAYSLLDDALKFIVARGNEEWRWETASILEFCRSLWQEILHPRLCEKVKAETYRDSFNRFLRNLQNIETYSICDEKDPFLQALAAFVIGGRDEGKLARLLDSQRVAFPEISLSLYGAVVGYSRFPRTLMNVDTYRSSDLPQCFRDFDNLLEKRKVSKAKRGEFKTKFVPQIRSGNIPVQAIEQWRKKAKKVSKKEMDAFLGLIKSPVIEPIASKPKSPVVPEQQLLPLDANLKGEKQERPCTLFIEDDICVQDLERKDGDLDGLSLETKKALAQSLKEFQKEYRRGGYYFQKEKDYKRDNKSTIDHFMRCLSSLKTKKYNVPLPGIETPALRDWLRERYG